MQCTQRNSLLRFYTWYEFAIYDIVNTRQNYPFDSSIVRIRRNEVVQQNRRGYQEDRELEVRFFSEVNEINEVSEDFFTVSLIKKITYKQRLIKLKEGSNFENINFFYILIFYYLTLIIQCWKFAFDVTSLMLVPKHVINVHLYFSFPCTCIPMPTIIRSLYAFGGKYIRCTNIMPVRCICNTTNTTNFSSAEHITYRC